MSEKTIWVPFEMTPCAEHGWACGGDQTPRFDLPSFRKSVDAVAWMIQPDNNAVHMRDGQQVKLQWAEYEPDEAVKLGFNLPKEDLH